MTEQPLTPDPSYYPPEQRSVFSTRIPSSVCFGLGVLLFLLPFAELRCKPPKDESAAIFNMMSMNIAATNTGLGLASGSEWKFNIPSQGGLLNDGGRPGFSQDAKEQEPNNYAIVALILAVAGFAISFARSRVGASLNVVTGILGAASLVGLMIDLKQKSESFQKGINKTGAQMDVSEYTDFDLHFTPWFYTTIVLLLAAAFLSYKRYKAK